MSHELMTLRDEYFFSIYVLLITYIHSLIASIPPLTQTFLSFPQTLFLMNTIHPDRVKQFFFLGLLVVLGWVLFRELQNFLPAFLGALTFYVLMRKWMFRLIKRRWKNTMAAVVLMLLSFLIIMLPIYFMVNMLSSKVIYLIQHSEQISGSLKVFINGIEKRLGYEILNDENIQKLSDLTMKELPVLLGATFNTLTTIIMMYFILYFMLTNAGKIENWFNSFFPLRRDNLQLLRTEIHNMVVSNAVGIPLIALLQGTIALIGYLILGVKEPFLWFGITCFTAMIPVLGAALAYVPLSIIFFAGGETWRGVALLIFGFGFIGTVDNIFRFWLQKKIGDVHPLITVFGVIIGVPLFGFIGLIFGPLLISMFLLLIKIYGIEFNSTEYE